MGRWFISFLLSKLPHFESCILSLKHFWIDSQSWWSWFPPHPWKEPTKRRKRRSFPLFSSKFLGSFTETNSLTHQSLLPFVIISIPPFPSFILFFLPWFSFFLAQKRKISNKSTALFINFTFRSFNLLLSLPFVFSPVNKERNQTLLLNTIYKSSTAPTCLQQPCYYDESRSRASPFFKTEREREF